jgi:uncharacterized protein (TIGR03067 family)
MRSQFIVTLVLLAEASVAYGQPAQETANDRVARLIWQLGHDEFAKREQASKELDAIGEPALPALGKAAAGGDPEVQRRAERLVASITGRIRDAVTKKELEKLQGTWLLIARETNGQRVNGEGHFFTVKGDKWTTHLGEQLLQGGTVASIEVKAKFNAIDLLITEGANVGVTAISIYALEGDSLKYLNSAEPRATDFITKPGDGRIFELFRRAKPGAKPRPPETHFVSAVFPTDLLVTECKKPVRRVTLTCRPADGETATLTLDPTERKFDAFGDPVADGKSAPVVTVEGTLRLVKAEKDRQLYELHGPKVVSRLSLVVNKDIAATGDGRLLVHGPRGEVRYVIDLIRPEMRFPPCHPGCFPAGTPVVIPGGTKAIERIEKGERVLTVNAAGKPAVVQVTGVFKTRNRLLTVRTADGQLITTETQPIALEKGGFAPAGELKQGDRIWRWAGGKRRATQVLAVSEPANETDVFNLIVGDQVAFIAAGFVVRGKPPAAVEARQRLR